MAILSFIKSDISCIMNKISVAYHKAIKNVLNMNTWDSNHLACEILGVNLFKHFQAKRICITITDLY